MLAVVPARGGSKGLPRKNLLPLAGVPLLVHALRFAELCPEIGRTVVSTDDAEIAGVARAAGGDVSFQRPPELAQDETPMWPVLRHALESVEREGESYEYLVLLDPTSPARLPEDVTAALALLRADAGADGVVSVAEPSFNAFWLLVEEVRGRMEQVFPEAADVGRRQDAKRLYRIAGTLYIWRAEFVRREPENWLRGSHVMHVVPESRAVTVDRQEDLEELEALVAAGIVTLPWIAPG